MRFTPRYTVSYHGVIRRANESFEIDTDDADEMAKHGAVEVEEPDEAAHSTDANTVEDVPVKRPGRPKKAN